MVSSFSDRPILVPGFGGVNNSRWSFRRYREAAGNQVQAFSGTHYCPPAAGPQAIMRAWKSTHGAGMPSWFASMPRRIYHVGNASCTWVRRDEPSNHAKFLISLMTGAC
jgi:hypothetical protein